ncbi:hypothetical protein [Cupriavidus sp. H18C1]|uniref:hypothetical protein n=1 Tax=Cupriavidus sp. H18C1 TaxID=3241601 RepID=UPI003BB8FB96
MHNVQIHVILAPLLRGAPIIFDYRTPTWRPRQSRATPSRDDLAAPDITLQSRCNDAAITAQSRHQRASNTQPNSRSRGAFCPPSPRIPIALRNAGRR